MANKEVRYFLKKMFLLCLVIIGLSLLLFDSVLKGYFLKIYPLQFAVIVLVTIFSHIRLIHTFQQNAKKFNTTFLSVMSIKLFIYLIFILVCLLIDRTNAINFVLTFLVQYSIFTIFEVIEISNFVKKDLNSSN